MLTGLVPVVARADTEDGGSGLSRVEHAYALPIGRPLFNLGLGYYSEGHDSTEARYMTLTPSITFGLGYGFEASLGVPLDGLTTTEGLGDYERRFDIRATEATAKLRYTANLGTPRVRFGVLGLIDVPLGDSRRPGGTVDPDRGYDPGLIGLLSFNFGPYDVPMRLHVNGGYWQSRNDGAVYFRDFPGAIPVPGLDPDDNDVIEAGAAIEFGFRGATAFAELSTEYLADGGDYMSPSEGYWRFTPGVRFKLSNTIAMTAAVSADVSSNDDETLFDPDDVYPDTEFQLALSLGRVFGQAGYETARRDREAERKREEEELAAAQAAAAAAAASRLAGTPVDEASIRAEMARNDSTARPAAVTASPAAPAPAAMSPLSYPPQTMDARMMELEYRLRFLEMNLRMSEIEARLRYMSPPPTYYAPSDSIRSNNLARPAGRGAATATPATTGAAPPPADTAAGTGAATPATGTTGAPATGAATTEAALIASQQREIDRLRAEMNRSELQPRERQVRDVPEGDDDDSREGAALAAGLVAGAAIGSSGNQSTTQPATTAPAPGSTGAAAATGAAAGTVAAGGTAGGAPPTTGTVAPGTVYPATAGERALLVALPTDPKVSVVSDPATRAALDKLAANLKANPDTKVLLLVHGSGSDAAAALKTTEDQAGLIREYLNVAGAGETQVQVLSLGLSEPAADPNAASARLEVARVR
jgi:hypothetical protein